ncbi:hypothetical protein GCM10022223_69880 [Kineosporia mesophila]|uniref:Uncharacterized protein n=1 Tax=Kineosporia mesophila TaxID=566012 RepID=A0ABP7AV95_9ACTN|nr:hypothetical protein [Kineosporia mesophila]MCD5355123.1 hypothetical protein [Kineosporia mesophila]
MAIASQDPVIQDRGKSPDNDPDWAGSEATRYLCVGVYLDRDFRRQVLHEVLDAGHRAVAPSYGIDIVPVLRHAIRAQRREFLRNLAFVAVLLVMLFIDSTAVVAGLLLAQSLSQIVRAWKAFAAGRILRGFMHAFVATLLNFLALGFLNGDAQLANSTDGLFGSGQSTGTGTSSGTGTEGALEASVVVFLVLWGLAWAVRLVELLVNHHTILTELSPDRFRPQDAPPEPERYAARIAFLADAQKGNVTYYSRSVADRPFVGSGFLEQPWHLGIPLRPRAEGEPPENEEGGASPAGELSPQTLYRRMRLALLSLADPNTPAGRRIVGLSMQPRLFVPGLLRRQDGLLDVARQLPRHHLNRAELDSFEQYDRNRATEYLTIRIGAWEGELEVTVFLYFSIRGETLYMEFVGAQLPSVRELYHSADSYQQLEPVVYLQLARSALGGLPLMLLRSPLDFVRSTRDRVREQLTFQGEIQEIGNRLAFDYGVRTSVRELGAEDASEQFFQRLDGQRYIYLVERRVRDAVAEVLEEFGYSNEEFLERTTTIINNSTQISGGTFNASSLAVGANAVAENSAPNRGGGAS